MSENLKKLRLDAGLTQSELSNKLGCTMQYYNMIENGKKIPSVQLSKKIASILGTDWTIFFNNEVNQKFNIHNNNNQASDQTHLV
ncbi:helix-turn-helix transcriptional regulator [Macrococcus caseolyticus]|uniref:helix-turn-helix transcriptional regulator n=1 Tax=Macrococcoides caseolyticum TaxID=69966 RepID=UPI002DBD1A76|nr:helix-turn-helix transcriptional regulator [Macrococcus caseolyticus]MEB8172206.1 helix-turn-helix transcriptional regulator [Macrococcus caseolyticus]